MKIKEIRIAIDDQVLGLQDSFCDNVVLYPVSWKALNREWLNKNKINILISRSVTRINADLLRDTSVGVVGVTSSGTDHVDKNYLKSCHVPLFSAPGSNAQAVKDYVFWLLAYLEKNKLLNGKQAGIIGVGHVGKQIEALLKMLDFSVSLNDPLRVLDEPEFISMDLKDFADLDLICLHPSLSRQGPFPSYHLVTENFLKRLKPNTVIINASRGGVIDSEALLRQHYPLHYCFDVFENEPHINLDVVKECRIATPHIAGHTIESFHRASFQVVQQIGAYWEEHYSQTIVKEKTAISNHLPKIDRRECQRWYDVILSLYDFNLKALFKPDNFYALREANRFRHDFSAAKLILNPAFPKEDKKCLLDYGLKCHEYE